MFTESSRRSLSGELPSAIKCLSSFTVPEGTLLTGQIPTPSFSLPASIITITSRSVVSSLTTTTPTEMSASLIVASVLAALVGVFFLYVYFRFLTGYADRRARLKRRQARTRRARRREHRERDVELGPVDSGIRRDPRVVRKPVQADVEFSKDERGRGFVDIPLDEDASPEARWSGAVGSGSEGDVDSGHEVASSSSSSKRSKTRDNNSSAAAGVESVSSLSSHTSSTQPSKQKQHPPPPRRAVRPPRRHRRDLESRRNSFQPSTPKPSKQAFLASSLPLPTHNVSDNLFPSSPYPPHGTSSSTQPPPSPPPAAAAAAAAKSNRISKSSNWSYRINQDGFEQVRYRGVPPPPSSYRPPPSVSSRYIRPASSVYYPTSPQPAFIRPASSVYPPSSPVTHQDTHTSQHLVPEPQHGEFLGSSPEENPFDNSDYEIFDNQNENEWTSRVASTAFTQQGSSMVGGGGVAVRDLTEVKTRPSSRVSTTAAAASRVSTKFSRMGKALEEALDKLTGSSGSISARARKDVPPPPPVPAIPATFLADVEAASAGGRGSHNDGTASQAEQQRGQFHHTKYRARVEDADDRESLGGWVRRGMAMSECSSP